jgi:hypothetical protein
MPVYYGCLDRRTAWTIRPIATANQMIAQTSLGIALVIGSVIVSVRIATAYTMPISPKPSFTLRGSRVYNPQELDSLDDINQNM